MFPFCTPCHKGGAQNCNPTLDTIYPWVDYREGECYVQLCLPWIPRNPSLWIPMPPVSLFNGDNRFTAWTFPSHGIADIWFNACCIATMLRCAKPTFLYFKVINIYITQICVYHGLMSLKDQYRWYWADQLSNLTKPLKQGNPSSHTIIKQGILDKQNLYKMFMIMSLHPSKYNLSS